MTPRVLLTSVGRRNYLVEFFHTAGAQVFGADHDPTAAALAECDEVLITPPLTSHEYVPAVVAFCRAHSIGVVVPLQDLDVLVLSAHRQTFQDQGISLLTPDLEGVVLCSDKLATFEALSRAGIPTPRTALAGCDLEDFHWPLVVKPRFGAASVGVTVCANEQDLHEAIPYGQRCAAASGVAGHLAPGRPDVIVQEAIAGTEVGMDVAADLSGQVRGVSARRKLAMRSGETDKAVILDAGPFEGLAVALAHVVGHRGNLDVDIVVDGAGTAHVIELNPRFGGGYPFSHMAGFDLVGAVVRWAAGDLTCEIGTAQPGRTYAKCPRIVMTGATGPG